jgi:hypothetical protein
MAERQLALPPVREGDRMSPFTGQVYDNDTLQVLQRAMNEAWKELRASDDWLTYRSGQSRARDFLAERIFDLAASGERDPDRLKGRALAGLRASHVSLARIW